MLPEMFSSSTMVMPTMSVMSPEPVTVRIGSEHMLPRFVIIASDVVTVPFQPPMPAGDKAPPEAAAASRRGSAIIVLLALIAGDSGGIVEYW